jgi:hypothetical protein
VLHDKRVHEYVIVYKVSRALHVGPDAAHRGRKVKEDVYVAGSVEHTAYVPLIAQVVVSRAGYEHRRAGLFQPGHQMRTEEAGPAGDDYALAFPEPVHHVPLSA